MMTKVNKNLIFLFTLGIFILKFLNILKFTITLLN